MSDRNTTIKVGGLMLIAGGVIGAGLALLFAPQSGKKTRRNISRYAHKARRRTEDIVDDFSHNVTKMVESVGDNASILLDRGADLAQETKKDILKAIEDGQEKLEKQRARLARLLG